MIEIKIVKAEFVATRSDMSVAEMREQLRDAEKSFAKYGTSFYAIAVENWKDYIAQAEALGGEGKFRAETYSDGVRI